MKKIVYYLRQHWTADYHPGYYTAVAGFLAVTIFLNYYFNFEDDVIDAYYGRSIRIFYYFLLYAFAYYTTTFLYTSFRQKQQLWSSSGFWVRSLFCLIVLAVDKSFHYHNYPIQQYLPPETWAYTIRLTKQLTGMLTTLLPLYIFYRWLDQRANNFYGLTIRNLDPKPYLFMLLIMMPLTVLASFNEGFLQNYPRYQPNYVEAFWEGPGWLPALAYELAYGLDFLNIELLFRGFMVLGMGIVMGRAAIVPMVVTYAFLHFGKSAGETVSSIFGGYILGVIAYQSRSVFGGVLIHVGVAWLMELSAYIQKSFISQL
ncbi:MAG: CPBP family intramembrane glutamic endopeptidase [Bacteroidota bacterium]